MRLFLNVFPVAALSLASVTIGCGGNPTASTGGTGGTGGSSTTGGSGGESTTTIGGGGSGGCMLVDDGNECTDEQCDGTSIPKEDGVTCDNADSTCLAGVCQPVSKIGLDVQGCQIEDAPPVQAVAAEDGDAAVSRLNFADTGTLEWVKVAIGIGGSFGCLASDRILYVTSPVAEDVPMSPPVYEEIKISKLQVEKGTDVGEYDLGTHPKLVRVHLKNPMPVTAGQHAYVALDMHPSACVFGCKKHQGVAVPPDEDFWCTNGGADTPPFTGCGAMNGPYPGVGYALKFAFLGGVALP